MKSQTWIFFSLCDTEDIPLAIFTIQFWWVLVFFELFPFLTPETVFLLCNSPGLILQVKRYCWKHWNMEPSTKNRKQTINQETPICQWYFYKEVIVLTFNLTRSGVTEKKSTQERHMQNCIHQVTLWACKKMTILNKLIGVGKPTLQVDNTTPWFGVQDFFLNIFFS